MDDVHAVMAAACSERAALILVALGYAVVGVGILRTAWINLDLIWTAALVITGGATLVVGLVQAAS